MVPPSFYKTFMLLRSTFVAVFRSAIDLIAFKAIGANSVAF